MTAADDDPNAELRAQGDQPLSLFGFSVRLDPSMPLDEVRVGPNTAAALERLLDDLPDAGYRDEPVVIPPWLAAAGPCGRCGTTIRTCVTGLGCCCSTCEHPSVDPDQVDADRYRWGT